MSAMPGPNNQPQSSWAENHQSHSHCQKLRAGDGLEGLAFDKEKRGILSIYKQKKPPRSLNQLRQKSPARLYCRAFVRHGVYSENFTKDCRRRRKLLRGTSGHHLNEEPHGQLRRCHHEAATPRRTAEPRRGHTTQPCPKIMRKERSKVLKYRLNLSD